MRHRSTKIISPKLARKSVLPDKRYTCTIKDVATMSTFSFLARRSAVALVLAGLLVFGMPNLSDEGQGGPVEPNNSLVTAKVFKYSIVNSRLEGIEPEQTLYTLVTEVQASENVDGTPNFTAREVGNLIKVYSKEELLPSLFGKTIEADVQLIGDEQVKRYWISNIRVIEPEENKG